MGPSVPGALQSSRGAELFEEALELEPKQRWRDLRPRCSPRKDSKRGREFAQRALELDPKLVEAQELLAKLALEDNNEAKAIEEAEKALKISPEALNAMAVRLAIDYLHDKKDSEWETKIKAINPVYGEAWALAGHILVLNRRYEEGIASYRKALELDPDLQERSGAAWREPDAAGRGEGRAQDLERLTTPGSKRADGELAEADGQLQEFRHLQDRQHHRPAA